MRRFVVSGVLACLLASVFVLPGSAAAAVTDGTGPLDNAADLAAMQRFEADIPRFDFGGMITPTYFDKWPSVDPTATPNRMVGEGDSGNYTGVYLAAQSWRYAQSKIELRKLGPNGDAASIAFWAGQRDEALARATEIIRYYHVLVNIASKWQTTFDPKIDSEKKLTEYGWLSYGGGIVKGQKGLLMRACTRVDVTPEWKDLRYNHAPTGMLYGPFEFEGHRWYCLNGTSRDSYAGTVFGLSVALDFVATAENPALRRSVANDLMAMADYAYKYYGQQPRPHGTVANPVFGHNDLTGPISPLFFPQAPIQRLHLLQTARHAAGVTKNKLKKLRYDALWSHEVATTIATGQVHVNAAFDATQPHDAYYKYQLELMSWFNVIRLEPRMVNQRMLRSSLSPMWASLRDDGNAFFEAMIYALTGGNDARDLAVTHHHDWLDYYAFHEATARRGVTPFVHTGRCNIKGPVPADAPIEKQPLECVPRARIDMMLDRPGGGELLSAEVPNVDPTADTTTMRAKEPLPVGVRRLADFLWQKDPTIITGDHDVPWQGPSIDFLVSYWMLRYYTEVDVPDRLPLPAWHGPRFK
jgi:hypothetical protein